MFANTKAFSGFAVDDVQKARKFYGQTLGLKTSEQYGLLSLHLAGDRDTLVYEKPDFTAATYTILNFPVEDIDEAVDRRRAGADRPCPHEYGRRWGKRPAAAQSLFRRWLGVPKCG